MLDNKSSNSPINPIKITAQQLQQIILPSSLTASTTTSGNPSNSNNPNNNISGGSGSSTGTTGVHHHSSLDKDTMDWLGFRNVSKVLIGDFQILGASILFGLGFIGQRTVSVDGLGPMTCNAFRFTLSAVIIFTLLPILDQPTMKTTIASEALSVKNAITIICSKLITSSKSLLTQLSYLLKRNNPNTTPATPEVITRETVYTNDEILIPLEDNSNPVLISPIKASERDLHGVNDSDINNNNEELMMDDSDHDYDPEAPPLQQPSAKYDDTDSTTNKYYRDFKNLKRNIMFWGVFLGLINFLGSGFQQWGIFYTTANKVAFISGFDLFFTPILTFLIPTLKHNGKPSLNIWIAVILSLFGLYLLSDMSITEFSMGHGEFFAMISALFWSLHIIYTDMATNYIDSIYIIAIQALVVGVLSFILALVTESMPWLWYHFMLVIPWLLCLSFIEAAGLVLMIKGQKYSPPTHAAIITSLEGVFASVASYLFLSETLDHREIFGCVLMLAAAFITEIKISLPVNNKKLEDSHHHLHNPPLLDIGASTDNDHTHKY